jgi:hypothetical protein
MPGGITASISCAVRALHPRSREESSKVANVLLFNFRAFRRRLTSSRSFESSLDICSLEEFAITYRHPVSLTLGSRNIRRRSRFESKGQESPLTNGLMSLGDGGDPSHYQYQLWPRHA